MRTNPFVFCACGCGKQFLQYDNKWRERKYSKGHYIKIQDNNPKFNGGIRYDRGYVMILKPDHPYTMNGYVYEHRLVMEKHLSRYLREDEIVHHINEVRNDNRIENLQLMTPSEHATHHNTKDLSDRVCFNCDSPATYIDKHGWPQWYERDNNYFCRICLERLWPRIRIK